MKIAWLIIILLISALAPLSACDCTYTTNELNFELSCSDSERFMPQILGFSGEVKGHPPFTRQKREKDASQSTKYERIKPKVRVNHSYGRKSYGRKKGSVVCIHGFMRTWRSMKPIGNVFRDCGMDAYLWDYPSRRYTISTHANRLLRLLKRIASEKPGEPINFVCHSLGGVILRRVLNLPDCPPEAKMGRAVLLAPPNKGAFVARELSCNPLFRLFFGKKSGVELMTYTEADINALGSFPEEVPVMVIAGKMGVHPMFCNLANDGKLAVFETYLNTPHFHCTVTVRHSTITNRPCIVQLCRKFIICKTPCPPEIETPNEVDHSLD